jgi:hypothetical protein
VQLPAKLVGNGKGSWRHIFGVKGNGVRPPELPTKSGKLTVELPPYGYHWFGRREGI